MSVQRVCPSLWLGCGLTSHLAWILFIESSKFRPPLRLVMSVLTLEAVELV